MKRGELAELWVPHELAYGEEGDLDVGVPPAAPIKALVRMLDPENELLQREPASGNQLRARQRRPRKR